MLSGNHWGGPFEINGELPDDDEHSLNLEVDPRALNRRSELTETQQSWLLGPKASAGRKDKYIDLGCFVCKREVFWWILGTVFVFFVVVGVPVIITKSLPKRGGRPQPPDEYSKALHKALLFFNAQKSGRLPKNNGIPWRGNSGIDDGANQTDLPHGLIGGYYDAGDNIKFHFPMAFAMSLLSWSVVEYSHKYRALGEYDHVREIIKWGTDYLLLTFNSSADDIDKIYAQVGVSKYDHYCWQRPEDMTYSRPVIAVSTGPDLAGEIAAALASAAVVFRDDSVYFSRLVGGAAAAYKFARRNVGRTPYSRGNPDIAAFYNSSGYWDEYMWSAAWMYYATGNASFADFATDIRLSKNANAFKSVPDLGVMSWDNKLPAAMLLWTRLRIFLNPGYPYEEALRGYFNATGLNMCSNLKMFNVFNWTNGGMIQLNHGRPQPLQYVVNSAFLANLYADYMDASKVPGWYCGPYYFSVSVLRSFASSQMNYVLGDNPRKISYVVGYGQKYPRHVHHRGASIPRNGVKYSCTGGWKWRDAGTPNPNTIAGAMVGGPDHSDGFSDVRTNYNYTEPTLAGNAGLVAALISLTNVGDSGVDKNTIFASLPPLFPAAPPPPPPWKP